MTIAEVKEIIHEREGIPRNQYRFVAATKILDDSRALSEYMLDHGSTLHMMMGLQGGK